MTLEGLQMTSLIVNTLAIVLTIVAFVAFYVQNRRRNKEQEQRAGLGSLLSRAMATGTAPVGLLLLACALQPALLPAIEDLPLGLAVAGLSLLYLAFEEGVKKLAKPPVPAAPKAAEAEQAQDDRPYEQAPRPAAPTGDVLVVRIDLDKIDQATLLVTAQMLAQSALGPPPVLVDGLPNAEPVEYLDLTAAPCANAVPGNLDRGTRARRTTPEIPQDGL
jgi:hypothetical protein